MKKSIKNPICTGMLLTFLLMVASHATSQTLTALHRFSEVNTNDGNAPVAGLVLSGKTLYGVTEHGGNAEEGVIFAINTDGTSYTNLHNFEGRTMYPGNTNNDGAGPLGTLILSGHTLYGTANIGGIYGFGTVFSVDKDGSDFTVLHSFANNDGAYPHGALLLSGRTLYGTTWKGGNLDLGTVFKMDINGSNFSVLHVFSAGPDIDLITNVDGAFPEAGLILSGTTLYGTASGGGNSGQGTVFALQTDGTGFTNLHNFSTVHITNFDGAIPHGDLVLSSNTLYGTAEDGGVYGSGTLFAINTDGTGFKVLHTFGPGNIYGDSADGRAPLSGMLLFANTLYGTTVAGGPTGTGTIFSMKTDGTSFTLLNGFTNMFEGFYGIDGAYPWSSLVNSGHDFYGTANGGEVFGDVAIAGTVFKLSLAPKLNMSLVGTNLVLTWPANFAGFDYSGFTLQCSTNPLLPNNWMPVSQLPASVNGQYVVTNSISGSQIFYRLVK